MRLVVSRVGDLHSLDSQEGRPAGKVSMLAIIDV
jgi:hypothetical protein